MRAGLHAPPPQSQEVLVGGGAAAARCDAGWGRAASGAWSPWPVRLLPLGFPWVSWCREQLYSHIDWCTDISGASLGIDRSMVHPTCISSRHRLPRQSASSLLCNRSHRGLLKSLITVLVKGWDEKSDEVKGVVCSRKPRKRHWEHG